MPEHSTKTGPRAGTSAAQELRFHVLCFLYSARLARRAAYGWQILRWLRETHHLIVRPTPLYRVLQTLEEEGLTEAHRVRRADSKSGASRKYVRLTLAGEKELNAMRRVFSLSERRCRTSWEFATREMGRHVLPRRGLADSPEVDAFEKDTAAAARDDVRAADMRALLRVSSELHLMASRGGDSEQLKRFMMEQVCRFAGASGARCDVAQFHEGDRAPREIISTVAYGDFGPSAFAKTRLVFAARAAKFDFATRNHHASVSKHRGRSLHFFLPLAERRLIACLSIWREQSGFSASLSAALRAFCSETAWLYQADLMLASPQARSLSPRERETLRHLLAGKSEKQIAREMRVSRNTIHHYVKALHKHFRVSSRSELLANWVRPAKSQT